MKLSEGIKLKAGRAWPAAARLFDRGLTALCLALTAAVYLLYILESDRLLTAEQAADVLAGLEMCRQKSLVLADWFYGTEVFTLSSPLFTALFSIFTGSVPWAHRLSVLCELALETLALAYMLGRAGMGGRPRWLAIALFLGARSYQTGALSGMGFARDATFHAALFLSLGYCAALASGVRRRPERILRYALPVAAFLLGLSSAVPLAILYLPLLACAAYRAAGAAGGVAGEAPAGGSPAGRILREVALWNALCLSGYLVLSLGIASRGLGPALVTAGGAAGFTYAARVNAPLLAGQFLDWTPLSYIRNEAVIRSWEWLAGWSFLFYLGYAAYMSRGAIRKARGPAGDAVRTLGACLAAAFLLAAVQLRAPFASVRPLLLVLPFAAVLVAMLYRDLSGVNGGLARLLLICIAFAVGTSGAANLKLLERRVETGPSRATSRHAAQIERILAENGVERAYALYWDSYPLEVLSSGRIRAGAVDGRLRPYLENASLLKYLPGPAGERTALVLSRAPRPWAPDSMNLQDASILEGAERAFRIDDPENPVLVYVYRGNPFTFDAAAERAFAAPFGGGLADPEAGPPDPAGTGGSPAGETAPGGSPPEVPPTGAPVREGSGPAGPSAGGEGPPSPREGGPDARGPARPADGSPAPAAGAAG
ncbi:MAG: hypothetical protein LBG06_04145 [Deltaproteobacteria bacterium]|jgi:hypothetical protein|nr:hypothetical protein [Deltaproteobacteria bacterium]